jgi:methionine synthase I (cobalamin-dependent)
MRSLSMTPVSFSQELWSHISNMDIRKELEKRILVIDGAMGTMIQRYELTERISVGSVSVTINLT